MHNPLQNAKVVFVRTLKQTCSQGYPRAQLAFKNLMIHEFCNSHYVSQFATFFIDVGAETSTVTSCNYFRHVLHFFSIWVVRKIKNRTNKIIRVKEKQIIKPSNSFCDGVLPLAMVH
eukprot:gb/GEZJ01000024.1/.p2 GENE.gb/GEZJ01000024.1/~~gb/GEZJ01000024.1/.p2  ORF type:complete len:117 (+),score=2.93 gb/GEZJ01000024.1/:4258-4608(+)